MFYFCVYWDIAELENPSVFDVFKDKNRRNCEILYALYSVCMLYTVGPYSSCKTNYKYAISTYACVPLLYCKCTGLFMTK